MNESRGRQIHALAEHAREDGKFLEALKYTDEATTLYLEDNDILGLAEVQGSRFLTLRHLFEATGKNEYLVLAKFAAQAAAQISEDSGIKESIALPFFNLAKAHETLNELDDAILCYEKAISAQESNADVHHARPAVLNDMKVHLYVCQVKNGKEEALADAESALKELSDDTEEGSYTKNVWVSGGHMKIAEALRNINPEKAKFHLLEAKNIIDKNPELVLRLRQWEKLSSTFSS